MGDEGETTKTVEQTIQIPGESDSNCNPSQIRFVIADCPHCLFKCLNEMRFCWAQLWTHVTGCYSSKVRVEASPSVASSLRCHIITTEDLLRYMLHTSLQLLFPHTLMSQ